jgi:hypothetical protein
MEQDSIEDLEHACLLDHVRVDEMVPDKRLARAVCERIDVVLDGRELAVESRGELPTDDVKWEGWAWEGAQAVVLGEIRFLEGARELDWMQLEDL